MKTLQVWSELRSYPQGVLEEVRKVSWPSRQTTVQKSIMVAIVVTVSTLIISVMDLVWSRVITLLTQ